MPAPIFEGHELLAAVDEFTLLATSSFTLVEEHRVGSAIVFKDVVGHDSGVGGREEATGKTSTCTAANNS